MNAAVWFFGGIAACYFGHWVVGVILIYISIQVAGNDVRPAP